MTRPSDHPIVIALLGPTGVGKSRLAAMLAPLLEAEIVSVDSMQIYRGMDIGTAKIDSENRRRVPHHLLDIVDPSQSFSVADFQKAARHAIEDIDARKKVPFLVGGTGLYFEAAILDMRFPPDSADGALRRRIEAWAARDPDGLRKKLAEIDPEFAAGESLNNMRRAIRAMEVNKSTGRPFSSFKKSGCRACYPYAGAVIDMPRPLLYEAIEQRVDEMMQAGLLDEIAGLKRHGSLSRTAAQALGYKEILEHLEGRKTLEESIAEIKQRSRRYAKRQITWFRHIPDLHWFDLREEDISNPSAISEMIREYFLREIKRLGERAGYGA